MNDGVFGTLLAPLAAPLVTSGTLPASLLALVRALRSADAAAANAAGGWCS
jgi:hypothetical protein